MKQNKTTKLLIPTNTKWDKIVCSKKDFRESLLRTIFIHKVDDVTIRITGTDTQKMRVEELKIPALQGLTDHFDGNVFSLDILNITEQEFFENIQNIPDFLKKYIKISKEEMIKSGNRYSQSGFNEVIIQNLVNETISFNISRKKLVELLTSIVNCGDDPYDIIRFEVPTKPNKPVMVYDVNPNSPRNFSMVMPSRLMDCDNRDFMKLESITVPTEPTELKQAS